MHAFYGHITDIDKSGKVKGHTSMMLRFDRLVMQDGRRAPIQAELIELYHGPSGEKVDVEGAIESGGRGRKSIEHTAIGAGAGALLGGIFGGGKGAGIGSIDGGAGGLGTTAFHGHRGAGSRTVAGRCNCIDWINARNCSRAGRAVQSTAVISAGIPAGKCCSYLGAIGIQQSHSVAHFRSIHTRAWV